MTKAGQVKIAEFKARLSEYLQAVRRGRSLTVFDRETPIARVVPYKAGGRGRLVVRRGRGKLRDLRLPPPTPGLPDVVTVLLEERQSHR